VPIAIEISVKVLHIRKAPDLYLGVFSIGCSDRRRSLLCSERIASVLSACARRRQPVNWEIILDRFFQEQANFGFGKRRDDVVSGPPVNEILNQLRGHFAARASRVCGHFENHVTIGAGPLMDGISNRNQQLERDKFVPDKSPPLAARLRMVIDHISGSRKQAAEGFRKFPDWQFSNPQNLCSKYARGSSSKRSWKKTTNYAHRRNCSNLHWTPNACSALHYFHQTRKGAGYRADRGCGRKERTYSSLADHWCHYPSRRGGHRNCICPKGITVGVRLTTAH
jgi:hypothetical protein